MNLGGKGLWKKKNQKPVVECSFVRPYVTKPISHLSLSQLHGRSDRQSTTSSWWFLARRPAAAVSSSLEAMRKRFLFPPYKLAVGRRVGEWSRQLCGARSKR